MLDQGVHVDNISREEAMRLMTHDTFQEEREAAGKWVRAQLSSAQLPDVLRRRAGTSRATRRSQEALGQRASRSSRYHDAVLSYGSPPVRYVRELMFDLPIAE